MKELDPKIFHDILTFGKLLVDTKDIDPIYPLLSNVIEREGLVQEDGLWLSFLYLFYYNAASAWATFQEFPRMLNIMTDQGEGAFRDWEKDNRAGLSIGMERRGLRGGKVVPVVAFLARMIGPGNLLNWLSDGLGGDRRQNYEVLWVRVQTLPQVGRWAAFKWLDLLLHVHNFHLETPDMRISHCSGPRQALEELYLGGHNPRQDSDYIFSLNCLGMRLKDQLESCGLPLTWDELETVLCNFHSLCYGRYVVGHDIDEHLGHTLLGIGDQSSWMEARGRVFDPCLLGELHGWTGIRKPLLGLYRDNGIIYNPLTDDNGGGYVGRG